ncbi:MAG TPA: metallophosphoesterase [Acetobacteraceae bacterium]
MRRRSPRALRAALDAASIPTWTHRPLAGDSTMLAFTQAPGWLAPGRRVYAVGDVRGDLAALQAMHTAIRDDLAARPSPHATLIHLGDVIGADTRSVGVLALLAAPVSGPPIITLRGDHEQMLLDALDGGAAEATDWWHETGVPVPRDLPAPHIAFLRGLPNFHREGGYFFAHAGIRPGIPLSRQSAEDLRGIRQAFLSSERSFGAVIVHGHSIVPSPVVLPNRIAIDTGSGLRGRLTCAVLEEDRIGFLSPTHRLLEGAPA